MGLGSFEALVKEGIEARIRRLEQDALKLLRAGQFERAQGKAVEARELDRGKRM